MGNFRPEKGVDVLSEAMGKGPLAARSDVDLVLVGSGPLERSMRDTARDLGIESRVHFPGRQPHEAVPDWFAACDVFCLPSRREGCPNVVLEALACGRPVVASAVGGVPELITEGENGLLVPAGDATALSTAVDAALNLAWDPAALRGSVGSLSWSDAAGAVHRSLETAVRAHAISKQPLFPANDQVGVHSTAA